jgi:type I restriction enzyme S subunit
LPKGWLCTQIQDISETTSGGTPSRKNKDFFSGDIPWLKSGELADNLNINSAEEAITPQALENSSAKVIPNGSLLIALYGATVGKLGLLTIDAAINQAICAIQPYQGVYPKYLFWYLGTYRKNFLYARKGGAQPNISQEIVRTALVPLAPTAEQLRIIAKVEELFSFLDAGVRSLRKVKTQLKRYRQAVLKYAFEGKLTEGWRKTHRDQMEPTTRMLEQKEHQKNVKTEGDSTENPLIDTSTLPKLPESWVWTRLSDIAEKIVDGSHNPPPKQAMGIPMLSARNILNNEIVFSKCRYISENDYREETRRAPIEANDVLLTIVGTIGRSAVVKESMPKFTVQRSVAVIKSSVKAEYLSFLFQSPFYSSYFVKNAKGTAQKGIYLNQLEELPIVLAPIPEQNLILGEIERQFSLVDKLQEAMELSSEQSERLRQSILTAAFDGELVPQDPNDEPAEKLLERIKEEKAKSKVKSDINRMRNKPKQLELSTYVK